MKKIIFICFTVLVSINLHARDCVSFEGVNNTKIVKPIIKQLTLLGVKSKINANNQCTYKIYLPIDIYLKNVSGDREIKIYLNTQKAKEKIEEKIINTQDTNGEIYDFSTTKKNLKALIIKEHSKIIAKSIKREFF